MKKWKMVHEFKIQSEKFKINELIDLSYNKKLTKIDHNYYKNIINGK